MSTEHIEALKLALEGAANYIDALGGDSRKYRQALAEQPAQQEPVALVDGEGKQLTLMQALDHAIKATEKTGSGRLNKVLVTAKRALAEQPAQQQEPVADINVRPPLKGGDGPLIASVHWHKLPVGSWLLYTSPPPCQTCEALARTVMLDQTSHDNQRKLVDLTDDEIIDVIHPLVMADMADEATDYEIARAIEAKLRSKNT